jgi:iron(III) transport system ATP-binding protein
VGTPLTVYREPASAFVADFVGKVNVLQGHGVGGRLYVGTLNLPGQHPPNGPVRAYVRPEDVVLNPPESAPGVVQARLERIDFLGDHCQLHVVAPALDNSALMLYASWHQISQAMLEVGATLSVQVLPERVKVF